MQKDSLALFCGVLIISGIQACSGESDDIQLPQYVAGHKSQLISGEKILTNASQDFGEPCLYGIVGDSLIVCDIHDGFTLSLVSIPGDSIVERFGEKGQGPGEILGLPRFQSDKEGKLYVYDSMRKTFYPIKNINESPVRLDTTNSVTFKDMTGGDIFKTTSGYVGDNLFGDGSLFTSYDTNGDAVESFGIIPNINKKEAAYPDFYMVYQVISAIAPDKRYLCAAGVFHDWLAFFDVSGQHPKLIKEYGPDASPIVESTGHDEVFHLKTLPETVKNYYSIAPFEDGGYLNYIGISKEELRNNSFTNHIFKFNWKGELQDVYSTEDKILWIKATPDGEVIYATSFPGVYPETVIFKYKLK